MAGKRTSPRTLAKEQSDQFDMDKIFDGITLTNFNDRITVKNIQFIATNLGMLPDPTVDNYCDCVSKYIVRKESQRLPNWRWHCLDCKKYRSPTRGTVFEYCHLDNRQEERNYIIRVFKLSLTFIEKMQVIRAQAEAKVERKAVGEWFHRFRSVMNTVNTNDFKKFSNGTEIDESCLCYSKYGRGRDLGVKRKNLWLLGFIDRKTKMRFMTRVFKRTIGYIDPIIKGVLAEGEAVIYTDMFRTYTNFMKRHPGFVKDHKTVCHKREFVNKEDSEAHTQNIEINWRYTKETVKNYSSLDIIDNYLAEYIYRCNNFVHEKYGFGRNMIKLLRDIGRVYAADGQEGISEVEIIDPRFKDGFDDDAADQNDFYDANELKKKAEYRDDILEEIKDCLSPEPLPEEPEVDLKTFKEDRVIMEYRERRDRYIKMRKTEPNSNYKRILRILIGEDGGWLNSDEINDYIELMKKRYSGFEYANTYLMEALRNKGNPFSYIAIRGDKKQKIQNIFAKDFFFIPVNVIKDDIGHWCLYVIDNRLETRSIKVNDSMVGFYKNHRDDMKLLIKFLNDSRDEIGLPRMDGYKIDTGSRKAKVPQQQNGRDCGMFIFEFMRTLLDEGEVLKTSFNTTEKAIMVRRIKMAAELIQSNPTD